MSQEVVEITEREIEVIEVVERGPAGPTGPQPNINYEVVSNARTLEAADLIAADTSGGAFTLTLPANPSAGDAVDIFDYSETFDTNPLTIARNGENIESIAEDLICNVEGAYFTMIYTGATRGWQILPRYGTTGGGGESVLTTQGDMVYRGAAINERLPIGSAGQILKVNSGGNAPEWGAAPATGVTSVGVTGSDGIEVDSGSPVTGSGTIALGVNAATLRSHINVADGANNYIHPNHSGEVTSSGDGATTIANDVVTNAKLSNVATGTIKGRATAGTGDPEDLSASQVRTLLNVADGAEVNVQADWDATTGDSAILNKPSTFTPSTHASSHHTGGSDAIAPSDIGAQYAFVTSSANLTTNTTLASGRTRKIFLNNYSSPAAKITVTLPTTGNENGDILVLEGSTLADEIDIKDSPTGSVVATLSASGQTFRFIYVGSWDIDRVYNHASQHASAGIDPLTPTDIGAAASGSITTSGLTQATARILGRTTASTGAVEELTVSGGASLSAGELAVHAQSHAITSTSDHTAGNWKVFHSNGSGEVVELALGDSGKVLQSNGASAAPTWETPSGGVSAIGASAADILSVSGSDIVADDLGADKLWGWDDSASKAIGYTIGSGLETDTTTLKTKITSDPSGVTGADAITNIMSLTQAEYDAIGSPNASTLYVITD